MESPEQTMVGLVNKTAEAGRGKGEGGAEKVEGGEFLMLLKSVTEPPKDEAKNPPRIPDHLWAQLLLLFPQLTPTKISGETNSGGEEESLALPGQGLTLTGLAGLGAENIEPAGTVGTEATGAAETTGTTETVATVELAETTITAQAVDPMPSTEDALANSLTSSLQASAAPEKTGGSAEGRRVAGGIPLPQQTKEAMVGQEPQLPTFTAGDETLATVGVMDSDGNWLVETAVMSSKERSEELHTTLQDMPNEMPETPQTGLRVNGESIGQHSQPSLTADGGSGFNELASNATMEQQPAPATKTAGHQADGNLVFGTGAEIGDELIIPEAGLKPLKSDDRPGTKQVESIFNPVEGANLTAQPAEEIAVANPEATHTPDGEALKAQIITNAKIMVKNGLTKVQIQLEPAELGKLELSLVVERDLVAARFVTENQGVQSLIEANLPELRTSLEEAGLRVDLLQVGVQTGTDAQGQNETAAGGYRFKRNFGWTTSNEFYKTEEGIFADEAWHGMVNLRV